MCAHMCMCMHMRVHGCVCACVWADLGGGGFRWGKVGVG